jgi:DNA mismatch endonuclease (patch repair protein)
VLPTYRIAVLVHGCFWHGHGCPRGRRPATNTAFWAAKLDANAERDRHTLTALQDLGWSVRVVWECELAHATAALVAELETLRAQALAESTR